MHILLELRSQFKKKKKKHFPCFIKSIFLYSGWAQPNPDIEISLHTANDQNQYPYRRRTRRLNRLHLHH